MSSDARKAILEATTRLPGRRGLDFVALFAASVYLLKQMDGLGLPTACGDAPFHPVARCLVVLVCANATPVAGRCFLNAVQRGMRLYGKTDTSATRARIVGKRMSVTA